MNESPRPECSPEFLSSLASALGSQAESDDQLDAFADALLKRFPSAIRLRPDFDHASLSFETNAIEWYSLGHSLVDLTFRPSKTLDYACGEYFIQDAGSMLALAACNADAPGVSGRLICDLCAAPGGKSSALLETIGNGFLLANEPIKSRVAPLAYNLARTGCDRYSVSSLDPEVLAQRIGGVFDMVLVDAPCSGQALLGRGKQTLAAVSATQIEHSAARARRILASATKLLRPGGKLVFSTCTFAEEENESQVDWLLQQDGVNASPSRGLDAYCSNESGCTYRLWPHRHHCAGSFAASVSVDQENEMGNSRRSRRKKGDRLPKELASWFGESPKRFQVAGAVIWSWPEDAPDWVESISHCGPEVAYRTGQTWKPAHEIAIRRQGAVRAIQSVDVCDESAEAYIAGQPIPCDASGWTVACHQGRPLGWVKASRGTGKNHLPGAARQNRS